MSDRRSKLHLCRARRVPGIAGATAAVLAMLTTGAAAQQAIPNGARDCQTVRVCNFTRGAAVRGCLSSYSCRTCRMVTTRCNIGGRTTCQEMVCSFAGVRG